MASTAAAPRPHTGCRGGPPSPRRTRRRRDDTQASARARRRRHAHTRDAHTLEPHAPHVGANLQGVASSRPCLLVMPHAPGLRRETVPCPTLTPPLLPRPPVAGHRPAPGAHGTRRAPWGSGRPRRRGIHRPAAPWCAAPTGDGFDLRHGHLGVLGPQRPIPPVLRLVLPPCRPQRVPHHHLLRRLIPGWSIRSCLQLPQEPLDLVPVFRLTGLDRLRQQVTPPGRWLGRTFLRHSASPLPSGHPHAFL